MSEMDVSREEGNDNTNDNDDDDHQTISDLVCVEYPGVVTSPSGMLNPLGGLDTIAQVLEEPNRRLELRYCTELVSSFIITSKYWQVPTRGCVLQADLRRETRGHLLPDQGEEEEAEAG